MSIIEVTSTRRVVTERNAPDEKRIRVGQPLDSELLKKSGINALVPSLDT